MLSVKWKTNASENVLFHTVLPHPLPFVPEGFEYQDVPNRVFMVRAMAPVRPLAKNEDLGIVTLNPLPGNALNFAAVRAVIRDFLRFEKRVSFRDI